MFLKKENTLNPIKPHPPISNIFIDYNNARPSLIDGIFILIIFFNLLVCIKVFKGLLFFLNSLLYFIIYLLLRLNFFATSTPKLNFEIQSLLPILNIPVAFFLINLSITEFKKSICTGLKRIFIGKLNFFFLSGIS